MRSDERRVFTDEERRRYRDSLSEEERQRRFYERSDRTMLQLLGIETNGMASQRESSIEARLDRIEKRLEELVLKQ
jgi:hypothetical protein